jgi:hypothetical protein
MNSITQDLHNALKKRISKVRVEYKDGHKEYIRIFDYHGRICKFRKGSSRKGYDLNTSDIVAVQIPQKRKSDKEKWEEQLNKIKQRLQNSGLWESLVSDIEEALKIGYEKMNQAYSDYWNMFDEKEEFKKKYPELVKTNEKGEEYIDRSLLWTFAKTPKVEKMRFSESKLENEAQLNRIKECMQKSEECKEYGYYGYDNSFEYHPNIKRAFYSREYKGCGNGYYYLALDATHAMFLEKD